MKSKKILACTLAITTTICSSASIFAVKVDAMGSRSIGVPATGPDDSSFLDSSRILRIATVSRNSFESALIGRELTQDLQRLVRDEYVKYGFRRSGIPKMTDGKMREIIKELDTELSCIEGQDEAIEKIKKQVKSILIKRCTEKSKGVDILYIIGPPGVGKSETAKLIAKVLLPKKRKVFSINESAVSGEEEKSLAKQLFSGEGRSYGDSSYNYNGSESDLLKMLKINSNTVLIIDEYDKIMTKCKDAEALLRNLYDNAEIVYNGKKIDCRGLVVIITSNEKGKSADLSECSAADKALDEYGRTNIEREESILDRLSRIEFKGLNDDALTKIAKAKITKEISAYQKKFGMNIKIDDSVYSTLIEKAKIENETNGSARLIDNRLLVNLRDGLAKLIASDETIKEEKKSGLFASFASWVSSIFTHRNEQKESRCIKASLDCDGNWVLKNESQGVAIELGQKSGTGNLSSACSDTVAFASNDGNWVFENESQDIEIKIEKELGAGDFSSAYPDTVAFVSDGVRNAVVTSLEESKESGKTLDEDAKVDSEDKEESLSSKRPLEAKVEMIKEEKESSEINNESLETTSEDKEEKIPTKRPLRAIVEMINEGEESSEINNEALETI